MTFIITSKTRAVGNRAPQGPVVLNKGSPQAQGLVAFYPMGMYGGGDLSGRRNNLGFTGGLTLADRAHLPDLSPAIDFTYDSNEYLEAATSSVLGSDLTNGWLVSWWMETRGWADKHAYFDKFFAGSLRGPLTIWGGESGSQDEFIVYVSNTSGGGFQASGLSTSTTIVQEFGYNHYAVAWDQTAGNVKFYRDGVLRETLGSGATSTANSGGAKFRIGENTGSSRKTPGVLMGRVQIYNHWKSDAFVRALYSPRTRWDLYAQPRRIHFIPESAGGGPTPHPAGPFGSPFNGPFAGAFA